MITTLDVMNTLSSVPPEAWWTDRQAGIYFGAIGGTALGCWGAAFGVSAGLLIPRGKGKIAVRILMYPMVAVALATIGVGIFALTKDQPRAVWYPLFLVGGILVFQLAWMIPVMETVLKRYEQKRLEAEELRRS